MVEYNRVINHKIRRLCRKNTKLACHHIDPLVSVHTFFTQIKSQIKSQFNLRLYRYN